MNQESEWEQAIMVANRMGREGLKVVSISHDQAKTGTDSPKVLLTYIHESTAAATDDFWGG